MKKELKQIINDCNEKRSNIYYNLNQLQVISGLSIRMLKYRMLIVKKKYASVTSLLSKEGRSWKIHYTLIDEFMPERNNKNRSKIIDWKSIVSWNTKFSYDIAYHQELINQIAILLPTNTIRFVVERDQRQINHVHAITDAHGPHLDDTVNSVLQRYLSQNEYHLQVNTINNKYSTLQYITKSDKAYDIG